MDQRKKTPGSEERRAEPDRRAGRPAEPDRRQCSSCATSQGGEALYCERCGEPLLEGRKAGSYMLLERLGSGGMGVVYRAEHERLGTSFAVKLLHRTLAAEEKIAARFLQEARATSRLRHEHIVFLADYGEMDFFGPYFAMEFLSGRPLTVDLEEKGALPLERALDLAIQMAETMDYAHTAGVIHRDLKPDNIFLLERQEGQKDFIKLLDFGIAKITQENELQLTQTDSVLGTPHYMSPEQAVGREVGPYSDLYAFGVILFQMLSGRLPFPGKTPLELLSMRLLQEPPRLSRYAPL